MQYTIALPEYTIYITAVPNKKAKALKPINPRSKGPKWYQEFLKSLHAQGTIRKAVEDMHNKGYPLKYSTARTTHWRFSQQES